MYTHLEERLFNQRFHGATNIKGIDFQIHYALNKALGLLLDNELESISFEGIEDIDLMPFQANNIYIQVKTSINNWHLNDLVGPIINFCELNTKTENLQDFELILNFEPRDTIRKLFSNIPLFEKDSLIEKVVTFKEIKEKQISKKQIEDIISKCTLKYVIKHDLVEDTKIKILNNLGIEPSEVDIILLSLLYKCIDWSVERKTIKKYDLIDFKIKFKENRARARSFEFEGYGKGLIDRVSWVKESQFSDYFEGKKTRTGHISLGLDVKRPKWLVKINGIFNKTQVCIIKAASGQGKSTLAFRYAHDYWNHQTTFLIKVVETAEQAEQISNYLITLAELGLISTVLIDDINNEKKYFSNVLQNCANYPITFLVTTRNDDYNSYGNNGQISLEFVIPEFDREEAKQIFQNLKKESRIHKDVLSSDWAYERISSPKCLIEFVFLITQGNMLQERLSQQIKQMMMNDKNSSIDFLRKVVLADICHTPININQLFLNETSTSDYYNIIQSLKDEFVNVEDNYLRGYHWVRSSHLLNILHENYANPAITALRTISILEKDKISTFIGNLAQIPTFDVNILISNYNNTDTKSCLSFINGLFKIGETYFFMTNKNIYDEAYSKFNEGVLILFTSKFSIINPINLFDIFGDNSNMNEAKILSHKFKTDSRGFNLVSKFCDINKIHFRFENEDLKLIGEVLDWSYWINSDLLEVNSLDTLINRTEVFSLNIYDFALFSQSLFSKYPQKHSEWFKKNKSIIINKLEIDLKCSISLNNNIVSISYSEEPKNGESYSDSTMKRLKIIRSAIPFCEKYNGMHTLNTLMSWVDKIAKLKYGYDESNKEIPAENLHFQSDVEKNKILVEIVESHYRVKTWYEFANCYYYLRKDIIIYGEVLCKHLNGKSNSFKKYDASYIADKILHSYKKLPVEIEILDKPFSDCRDSFNNFTNFLLMKSKFITNESDEDSKRLLFINYNNFIIMLPKMQLFFEELKGFSPDYFRFEELDKKEIHTFHLLKALLQKNVPKSEKYWNLNTIID